MQRQLAQRLITAFAATALAGSMLAACSPADEPNAGESPTEESIVLTIGNRPPATEAERRVYFDAEIEEFKANHPNLTVEVSEDGWDSQTFAARLQAGDLPTVVGVPFTEITGLIERGQAADITDAVISANLLDSLNPTVVDLVSSSEGRVFGIPTSAYAMGLVYNRALFTEAGLDPDNPPATWDEVRVAAKTITDSTDAYGFGQVTTENMGGWVLAAQIASRGGSLVNETGENVTFDSAEGQAALQLLHDMRWEDESLTPNATMGLMDLAQAFGGNQIGMFVLHSETYQALTEQLGFPSQDYGFSAMPTTNAADQVVTLTGGNIDIVSPNATPGQIEAAVEWIEFHQLKKYTDEQTARAAAQALADQGTSVAIPGVTVVTTEKYDQYFEWISDINNVPIGNFRPYLDRSATQIVQSEPAIKAQEVYAALDPVVQAVLSDSSAETDTLLTDAEGAVTAILSR